jgi:hypothetical protein
MPGAGAFRAAVVAAASAAALACPGPAASSQQQQQQGSRRGVIRGRKAAQASLAVSSGPSSGLSGLSGPASSLAAAQQQEALQDVLQAVDQSNSLAGILQDPCDPFMLAADRRLAAATAVLRSCSGQGLLQPGAGCQAGSRQGRLSGPAGSAGAA